MSPYVNSDGKNFCLRLDLAKRTRPSPQIFIIPHSAPSQQAEVSGLKPMSRAARVIDMDLENRFPWPNCGWLRSMMVISPDGATTGPDGLSGSLSGPADRRALLETRRLADAIVVGAETIRAERYKPMVGKPEWLSARAAAGLKDIPQLVIVSRELNLPWKDPLFNESEKPVTIATVSSAATKNLEIAKGVANVITFGDSEVNLSKLLTSLRNQGLYRIVCEGGEALVNGFNEKDLIDEMNFTISPRYSGSKDTEYNFKIARRLLKKRYPKFQIVGRFIENGFVFCRLLKTEIMN